jgi:hypothetical protein
MAMSRIGASAFVHLIVSVIASLAAGEAASSLTDREVEIRLDYIQMALDGERRPLTSGGTAGSPA